MRIWTARSFRPVPTGAYVWVRENVRLWPKRDRLNLACVSAACAFSMANQPIRKRADSESRYSRGVARPLQH